MVAQRQQHKGECHAACDEAAGQELVHCDHLLSLIVVALTCVGAVLVILLLRCPVDFLSDRLSCVWLHLTHPERPAHHMIL